jgi:hypothetical protein
VVRIRQVGLEFRGLHGIRAAMRPAEQAVLFQQAQIAPDGFRGSGQFGDVDFALSPGQSDDLVLAHPHSIRTSGRFFATVCLGLYGAGPPHTGPPGAKPDERDARFPGIAARAVPGHVRAVAGTTTPPPLLTGLKAVLPRHDHPFVYRSGPDDVGDCRRLCPKRSWPDHSDPAPSGRP